jgi:hypothetical protein
MVQICFNPDVTPLDCVLLGWVESEVYDYKTQVDAREKLLARILDAAACIKKRKEQPRRKKN